MPAVDCVAPREHTPARTARPTAANLEAPALRIAREQCSAHLQRLHPRVPVLRRFRPQVQPLGAAIHVELALVRQALSQRGHLGEGDAYTGRRGGGKRREEEEEHEKEWGREDGSFRS